MTVFMGLAVAGSATTSWGVMLGGGAASGAASGVATSLVQQFVDNGSVDAGQVAKSVLWGTIGGAIGGAALKGIGGKFGALDKSAMHCNLGAGRVGTLAGVNALAGGVGGGLADTVTQLGQWAMGDRSGFSFRQAFAATVAGAAGGAAGYMASRSLFKACFAADMPMRTKFGSVRADEVCVGMKLLSRDEYDADGVVEEREVEEVFVRQALIWNLRVLGQLIRSTAEHPFYVMGKGWVPLHAIVAGDYVWTEASGWLCVEAVEDTGEWATVYNFRIAEWHTYFVGKEEWGWSLWAHNADGCSIVPLDPDDPDGIQVLVDKKGSPVGDKKKQPIVGTKEDVARKAAEAGHTLKGASSNPANSDNTPVKGKRYRKGTDVDAQVEGLSAAQEREVKKAKQATESGGEFEGERRPKQIAINSDEKTQQRKQEDLNNQRNQHNQNEELP